MELKPINPLDLFPKKAKPADSCYVHPLYAEKVEVKEMPSSSLSSLADLASDWEFVSFHLPMKFGSLPEEVLADLQVGLKKKLGIRYVVLKTPLCYGLGRNEFGLERLIWLVPKEIWPHLKSFLSTVRLMSKPQRLVYVFGLQRFRVPDLLAAERGSSKHIDLFSFTCDTNLRRWVWIQDIGTGLLVVKVEKPLSSVVKLFSVLSSGVGEVPELKEFDFTDGLAI